MIEVVPVSEHKETKEKLLAMHERVRHSYEYDDANKFNTLRSELRQTVLGLLEPYFFKYALQHGFKDIRTNRVWFTHYDNHIQRKGGWHNHTYCSLTAVYQLDIPSPDCGTVIYGHDIKVKEGDLLIFPSFLAHCSPNIEGDVKTVVGLDFDIFESWL